MKRVLACRDSGLARYVAHQLADAGLLNSIVVESGTEARRSKLERQFGSASLLRKPQVALDLFALAIYGKLSARHLQRTVFNDERYSHFPELPRFDVDDINEDRSISHLTTESPDVLVILGTAILKAPVIAIPTRGVLNIHGGIVPQYRNVHSDFWACYRGEPEMVGISIMYLDEGIDTGDIVTQATVDDPAGLFDAKAKNAQLAARLIVDVLVKLEAGELPRETQAKSESGFYPSPGLRDLVRYWRGKQPRRTP